MKIIIPFLLLFAMACNQPNPDIQNQIKHLEEKLAAAEKTLNEPAKDETAFIHTVFFWMKKEITEEQKADFAKNGLGGLTKISSIYKFYYGPPAMTDRTVVDNSYDFALVCHFKSVAAQDEYQDDPIHLEMIEKYKDLWEKVQVYDNLLMD